MGSRLSGRILLREFGARIVQIDVGHIWEVVTTNPSAKEDLPSTSRLLGYMVRSIEPGEDGKLIIRVEHGKRAKACFSSVPMAKRLPNAQFYSSWRPLGPSPIGRLPLPLPDTLKSPNGPAQDRVQRARGTVVDSAVKHGALLCAGLRTNTDESSTPGGAQRSCKWPWQRSRVFSSRITNLSAASPPYDILARRFSQYFAVGAPPLFD
jgi:TusA-related sulfurtransferase